MKKSLLIATLVFAFTVPAHAMSAKDVYKKSSPGVVLIMGSDDGKVGNSGTGSIISGKGYIITNAHVVISNATKKPYKTLQVYLKPDRISGNNRQDLSKRYNLTCSHWSDVEELDLALCKISNAPANLTTIAFTNPDDVEIGDNVVAIGHPEQGGLWTLTTGTVSSVIANFNRIKGKDVFQTEASVNRGNSGGPLLDENGNMVGINTMIARTANDGLAITDINFSLKSSVAVNWLRSLGVKLAYATNNKELPAAPVAVAANDVAAAPKQENAQTVSNSQQIAATPTAAPAKEDVKETAKDVSAKEETKVATAAEAPTAKEVTPAAEPVKQEAKAEPVAEAKTNKEEVKEEAPAAAKEEAKIVITVEVESAQEQAAVAPKMEAQPPVKEVTAQEKVSGTKVDPQKAKPQYLTKKRPYNMDTLRKQQMQEMEDMMEDFHNKIQHKKR